MAVTGRLGVAVEPPVHLGDRLGICPAERPDLGNRGQEMVVGEFLACVEGQLEPHLDHFLDVRAGVALGMPGQVKITLPKSSSIAAAIKTIQKERLVRKIKRAGHIRDGAAFVNIDEQKTKTIIRVSVVGMSIRAVHRVQPRVHTLLDPTLALLPNGPPGASADAVEAACKAIPSTTVETIWKANVSGYDSPRFGPGSLLRLLTMAMPKTRDATGIRLARCQDLGGCKACLKARMPMPKPIKYRRYRGWRVEYRTTIMKRVYNTRRRCHDLGEVTEIVSYRCKWYQDEGLQNDSPMDDLADRLDKAIVRAVLRMIGRKLNLDRDVVDMAIGWNINKQRDSWRNNGRVIVPTEIFDRLSCPRCFIGQLPALLDPLIAVDGYMPPPEKGDPLWELITDELHAVHDPKVVFVIRSPGRRRGLAVIHQDADATAFGKANRIGRSQYYIQPFDSYLEFCWEIWGDRPDDKSDLFRSVA